MRVAIIGAGAAGLASARHVSAQGIECEVLEMAPEVGGTWVYTDDIEKDSLGYPVHTAMYKGLRANLPKEIMGFPDFPIPEQDGSFLDQATILHFLNLYADHFNLKPLIKFNHIVTEVRPNADKWLIKAKNKITKTEITNIYDVVMICNGHYNTPINPTLAGQEKFKGHVMHSHQYRSNEPFKNQRVLVIGAGPSGLDVAFQVSEIAQQVVISYDMTKKEVKGEYPSNVVKKPQVLCIKDKEEVEFIDGSCCSFDTIIYCTGYRYNFPFLHDDCGVSVEDFHVRPLYKHMIHIEKPTMCFIGIPYYVCAFQMFDIQARFYCQYLNGSMSLPTKELMYKDTEEDIIKRKNKGYSEKQMHLLGHEQQTYFEELASTAKITPILPVICKIWSESDSSFYKDLKNFRKYKYRILNNNSFVTERYIQ
ncbi:senecionine N-oxygenase-like [Tribolium madens]|uniref:senecionine N-oxygenase-like n=1 Tax=Tribolium madens TaxID=41895 RepID=UPI001CF7209A|nr:senecionine N-oxygenase-like [Tribolium madens]XP_044263465.1 senecionine N-oxygenase-like [Tribolium madens]